MIIKTKHLIFVNVLGASLGLHAATAPTPGAIQRLDQDSLERSKLEKQLQKAAPQSPEITVPGQSKEQGVVSDVKNIPVTRFDIDSSELLTTEEIRGVLDAYEGKTVSLNDLYQAVNDLNKLYDAKGVKTARAILPAQEVRLGIVKIRLIEARLGELKVSGAKYLNPDFVGDRIHQRQGDLVSVTQLESDLVRFNSLYATKLRADVTAGAKVGTTDITIDVQEPKRYQLTTFADNAGRESVGDSRLGVIFNASNLTGRNDNLQLLATGTQGSDSYGLSYSVPVSTNDLRLDVAYNHGSIKLVNGPFVPLDISGRSQDLSLGLTQPLSITMNRQWAAYGRFSSRNSVSLFGGLTQQDVGLHVFSMGISGEAHFDDYAWTLDNSLNVGTKAFGANSDFSYFRASASRVDRLSGRLQLITKAGLQYSFTDVLPAGEQFQVGGLYSVRGFPEGLLSGRHGYFGSVELRAALNSPSPEEMANSVPGVHGLVFLDHGGTLPYRPGVSVTKNDSLSSAGFGLIFDFGSKVSARLTLAYPLENNPAEDSKVSPRIHMGINIQWL
ncbi:ShlB/FhaC/HecB family hemolysin secretion/activation protein [Rhodoferax sp. PAMC 29310]|uniref:ShlB/FhaC/HecB family hemolysin secretion/activation protein n=1 Tax=Rhodoferax sp. PAMC 29310 TaxID=2822760 RepID=UPI001B3208F0|nr:ShlB/FhaC/HecB family hemolysin secretion/activation protein [Rhodoferax sp. PAMC 29310]